MQLYTLLRDRASINILKILHDNEFVDRKKHTMHYSEMKAKLRLNENSDTILNLESAGLISTEKNGNGERILCITQKGKDFIAQFDRLVAVMYGKKEEHKSYEVKYELTMIEQRILVLCSKMKAESGAVVPLTSLAQEVYPYKDSSAMAGTVSKSAKKLEELNLITRIKNDDKAFFDVTESGERVIREQVLLAPQPML